MIKKFSYKLLQAVTLLLLISSCNNTTIPKEQTESESELYLSRNQFNISKMETGSTQVIQFETYFETNGFIKVAPQGKASVSFQIPGVVQKVFITDASIVKKGDKLFSIVGNQIIDIQSQYLEALFNYKNIKATYERQSKLSKDFISPGKEIIEATNNYLEAKSRLHAIAAKLSFLNIDTQNIANGNIEKAIIVSAPVSGRVTMLNVSIGQPVEPGTIYAEIIDLDQRYLHLQIFQQNALLVQPGQKVTFTLPGTNSAIYNARIISKSASVQEQNNTVTAIAQIESEIEIPVGSYVNAKVYYQSSESVAIEKSALLQLDNHYYILRISGEDENGFNIEKIPVEPGIENDNFVALNLKNHVDNIITKGVYHVNIE